MLPPPQKVAESDKKSKAQSGFKRALVLFIILMIFAIIHTIIQRLSDNNFNVLFTQLFNKMKSMELSFCHDQHKMPHTFHQPGGGKERGLLLRFIVVPQHAVSGLSESECSKTWLLMVHASKISHLKYAWDGDPNTIWHPTGSGEGAYTTLHLNEVRRKY